MGAAGVSERAERERSEAAAHPDADAHHTDRAVLGAGGGVEREPHGERVLGADPEADDDQPGKRRHRVRRRPRHRPSRAGHDEARGEQDPGRVAQGEPPHGRPGRRHAGEHSRDTARRGGQRQARPLRQQVGDPGGAGELDGDQRDDQRQRAPSGPGDPVRGRDPGRERCARGRLVDGCAVKGRRAGRDAAQQQDGGGEQDEHDEQRRPPAHAPCHGRGHGQRRHDADGSRRRQPAAQNGGCLLAVDQSGDRQPCGDRHRPAGPEDQGGRQRRCRPEGQAQCDGAHARRSERHLQQPAAPEPRQQACRHQTCDDGPGGEREAVQAGDDACRALLGAQQLQDRAVRIQHPTPGAGDGIPRRGHAAPGGSHPSSSTTKSTQRVSASTSSGSTAGNIAMRSWLRPSLR